MENWRKVVTGYAITPSMMEVENSYLIDGFIPKQMVSVWYADGGVGKSYLALGVCSHLLEHTDVDVVYLDGDNSLAILKERRIDSLLLALYPERMSYLHRSSMEISGAELLTRLGEEAVGKWYENVVFVIDSLKDVVGDLGNDVQVGRMMRVFMNLREAGATILILHHTNKDGKNYQGSNQIRNGADVMYTLSSRPDVRGHISYVLEVQKERAGVVDMAYRLDVGALKLTPLEAKVAKMAPHEQQFVSKVLEVLGDGEKSQGDLLKAVGCDQNSKGDREMLEKFVGVYWVRHEKDKKNRKMYQNYQNYQTAILRA